MDVVTYACFKFIACVVNIRMGLQQALPAIKLTLDTILIRNTTLLAYLILQKFLSAIFMNIYDAKVWN